MGKSIGISKKIWGNGNGWELRESWELWGNQKYFQIKHYKHNYRVRSNSLKFMLFSLNQKFIKDKICKKFVFL